MRKVPMIIPEPCPFLTRKLPPCSVIRPTETRGVAMGTLKFLGKHTSLGRQRVDYRLVRTAPREKQGELGAKKITT